MGLESSGKEGVYVSTTVYAESLCIPGTERVRSSLRVSSRLV